MKNESQIPEEKPKEIPKEKPKRIYWLDHARGYIMIMLVVTMFLPRALREGPLRFFLEHPENSTTTTTMNFFDIGTPAFILIMGLLMPLSFRRRKEKSGTGSAVTHMLIRYGIILGLGLLVFIIDGGEFIKTDNGVPVIIAGIPVIRWDVLPTLGLVGFIALPFLWLKPKPRALAATGMVIFYQIMLIFTEWRDYAIASVHGGILGTIFGFSAQMIYATCAGDYLLLNEKVEEKKKYAIFAIIGALVFAVGFILWPLPEMYPNKRQVTLTYILISSGASILIALVFIAIDKKVQKPIFVLDSYGKSLFLVYIIAIVLEFLIVDIIGYEIDWIIGLSVIALITAMVLILDRKKVVVKL
jgi:hypothetical protein